MPGPIANLFNEAGIAKRSSLSGSNEIREPPLLDLARWAQRLRTKIAMLFPRDVFLNSAWDIMLELFVAGQQNRTICVKELILVSGETSTSALRRIDRLETMGLLRRRHDPLDHRRVMVALTARGDDAMSALLRDLLTFDSVWTGGNADKRSLGPRSGGRPGDPTDQT